MIDVFTIDKSKYEMIYNTGENVKLTKRYDLIYTSPPYFDLEKYTSDKNQSISKYNNEKSWFNIFLKVTLIKVWSVLDIKGYMCININQKHKNEKYVSSMIKFVNSKLDSSHYLGIISYSNSSIIKLPTYIYMAKIII